MENREPIFIYDSRTQFTRPMFVVYDYDHIDLFLMKLEGIPELTPRWTRPDWVYVSKQRMHPYEPDPYKVPGTSMGKSARTSARDRNSSALISNLSTKNRELERENIKLRNRAEKAEADVESWKASNMNALRDLAIDILTKK